MRTVVGAGVMAGVPGLVCLGAGVSYGPGIVAGVEARSIGGC